MKIIRSWKLSSNIQIAEVDAIPSNIFGKQAHKYIIGDIPILGWKDQETVSNIKKLTALRRNFDLLYKLELVVLENNKIIGWTVGWQDSFDKSSFFMGGSVIIPSKRRRGFYTQLVKRVFAITKQKGFSSIWSVHAMVNNSILIAKLKAGFNINGFEIHTAYGPLVRLVYHHSKARKQLLRFRAGAVNETSIYNHLKKSLKP